MKKLVWGILSSAKIGREKVIPAMQAAQYCDVQAIASRSLARARQAATALGIPRAYGSYEDLLADPAIEAVYNPLPNEQHVALTLQAARAGKHVLCEKPMALHADELVIMAGGRVTHQGTCNDTATHRALEQVFDHRIAVHQLAGQWVAVPKI